MTTTTVPETLRAAADRIEKVGLAKGQFFARPKRKADGSLAPLAERPCCTMGAIGYETGYYVQEPDSAFWDTIKLYDDENDELMDAVAKTNSPEEERALMLPEAQPIVKLHEETRIYLSGYLDAHKGFRHIPSWNDDYATTQEGVVRTLRAAADAYMVEGV